MRDAHNIVKLRAQRRARELGKTLGEVYEKAGVNKAYLSEVPKTGWRENKLRMIAEQLEWSVDLLMRGTEDEEKSEQSHDQLLGMAAEAAARLLAANGGGAPIDPSLVGQLTVMLFRTLQEFVESGLELPSDAALGVIARQLLAAVRNASVTS